MNVGNVCSRTVIFVDKDESVRQAAGLMRQYHVGDLVVIDAANPLRTPIGMVTDRDITVEVVAMGIDPDTVKAGDIMSRHVVLAREADSITDVARLMRDERIRRMPIVGKDGALVGIVASDDLLELVNEELGELAQIPDRQRSHESMVRK